MTSLPSGTVTFLFTDIEGSTRLWDDFPEDMRRALKIHDAAVAKAVTEHCGHTIKNTGDGVFAAFSTADGGVTTAISARTHLARSGAG